MVIISSKKLSNIIKSRINEETPEPQRTNLYRAFKKVLTPITIASIILLVLYVNIFEAESDEFIRLFTRLFFRDEAPGKLQLIAALLISYAVYYTLYVIIHELIHIIFSIDKQNASVYISIGLPTTVSAFYDAWISKKKELLSLIAPTVVISVLLVPLFWILPPFIVGLQLILHLLNCSSDIFAFFYLRKALPENCIVYGHYYKPASIL